MRDTVGKVRTNSQATFSYRPLHTDVQVLDDQLEPIYGTNTGYRLENLPNAMDDRNEWRERERVRDTIMFMYICMEKIEKQSHSKVMNLL